MARGKKKTAEAVVGGEYIVVTNKILYKGTFHEIGAKVQIAEEDLASYEGVIEPAIETEE